MKTWADLGILTDGHSVGAFKTRCPGVDGNGCSKNGNKKDLSVDLDKGAYRCHNPGCEVRGYLNGSSRGHISAGPGVEEKIYRKIGAQDWIASTRDLPPEAVKYLHDRGFSDATLRYFGLRWGTITRDNATGRWINGVFIPYPAKDPSDHTIVNLKKRPLDKADPMGMAGTEKESGLPAELIFYNIRSRAKTTYITEGEYDVLACKEAGLDACMSVPNGVPSDDPEKIKRASLEYLQTCADQLAEIEHFVMMGDDDRPGRALQAELVRRLGPERCSYVVYPEGSKDANDVLLQYGPEKLREIAQNARPYPVAGLVRPDDMRRNLRAWKRDGKPQGVSTGWPDVDRYWRPTEGYMTIITGIPSSGKSEWLDALVINLYRLHGWKAVFFSPEAFPSDYHLANLLEKHLGKPYDDVDAARWRAIRYPEVQAMTEEEMDAGIDDLELAFSFIQPDLDGEGITLDHILDYARAEVFRRGVKVLVIDPFNEISHLIPGSMREDQYVSKTLSRIRRFARQSGVHVFVVAHPSKMQKVQEEIGGTKIWSYPIPTMYDISGGAMWFNKADNGISIWRDFHAEARGENPNVSTVSIQKVKLKWTGTKGDAKLVWYPPTGTYSPIDATSSEPESSPLPPPVSAALESGQTELLF